jgi:D-alanyl-D-alanine carboxypeptidase/D-alanyl-D-alanine-endopeptidase (penicillin-binding protein 4)
MFQRYFFLFCLMLVAGCSCPSPAQNNAAITAFIKNPSLKHAGIGIKVVEIETGKKVCSCNADMALTPASTLKALTTATALEIFGPEYRFSTRIAYRGHISSQGMLEGDLLIVGSGDPTLGTSFLNDNREIFLRQWLDAIRKAGVKAISGNIIAVDDLYGYEGVSDRWTWGDIGNYYAAPVYGISVFDNAYRLYFKTGAPQSVPEILYTDPAIPGLFFENHLKAADNSLDSAYIHGIPFSYERRIYGTVPANKASFSIKGDIPDPGMFLAQKLADYLNANGIRISGNPTTSRLTSSDKKGNYHEIYTCRGNSLQEIIQAANFRSNNHFAEHLFYKIGWDKTQACTGHVPALAAQRIRTYWQQKGIDTEGLFQYDGSGLSSANAITASMLVSVLAYMQKQSRHADVFYRSLPLAGKEGTVKAFLKGTKSEGTARIKSGSISNVQAYAGYMEKNGKRYAFAVFINYFTGSRAALKEQIARLIDGLAVEYE